jgi:CRISPR/Cas system CMR-associated protein Cmr5 small subunit
LRRPNEKRRRLKLTADRTFADLAVAARKLLKILNAIEAVQDGRIYIEKINDQFLNKEGPRRTSTAPG